MSACLETTLSILGHHLRRAAIGPELLLERDLGVDPFELLLLVAALEEALQVRVAYADLPSLRTVADLALLLEASPPASLRPTRLDSGCLAIALASRDTA
jgi:acyl carrier protein